MYHLCGQVWVGIRYCDTCQVLLSAVAAVCRDDSVEPFFGNYLVDSLNGNLTWGQPRHSLATIWKFIVGVVTFLGPPSSSFLNDAPCRRHNHERGF